MNFYDFMKNNVSRDDKVGDVARDIVIDENFPKSVDSVLEIKKYFRSLLGDDLTLCSVNMALEESLYEWKKILPVDHLDHPTGFVFDDHAKTIDLWWSGYGEEYSIALDRINTPSKLLTWIAHFAEKGWEGQTPYRIGKLVTELDKKLKWHIPYGC